MELCVTSCLLPLLLLFLLQTLVSSSRQLTASQFPASTPHDDVMAVDDWSRDRRRFDQQLQRRDSERVLRDGVQVVTTVQRNVISRLAQITTR